MIRPFKDFDCQIVMIPNMSSKTFKITERRVTTMVTEEYYKASIFTKTCHASHY